MFAGYTLKTVTCSGICRIQFLSERLQNLKLNDYYLVCLDSRKSTKTLGSFHGSPHVRINRNLAGVVGFRGCLGCVLHVK